MADLDLRMDFSNDCLWLPCARMRSAAEVDRMLRVLTVARGLFTVDEPQPLPAAQTVAAQPFPSAVATPAAVESVAPIHVNAAGPATVSTGMDRGGSVAEADGTPQSGGAPVQEPPETSPADPLRSGAATRKDAEAAAPATGTENAEALPPAGEEPHASPAPRAPRTDRQRQIVALHAEHPEWTVSDFAKHFAVGDGYISNTLKILGITVPRKDGRGGITGPKGDSLSKRIRALAEEDPSRTIYDIAALLGETPKRIRSNANAGGIKLRRLTPAELSEALKARPTRGPGKANEPAQDARPVASVAEAHASPERLPAIKPAPKPVGSVVITKATVRPRGTRFYLRDEAGLYLHQSLTLRDGKPLMTDKAIYAWCDVESRILAVRRVMPEATQLREQVADKEQSRAAA
jgi:hypothetical protein